MLLQGDSIVMNNQSVMVMFCRPVGNYQHMIQFWWSRIFEQPAVKRLQYFCRLDTDSLLTAPSPIDIFLTMRSHKYSYGYRVKMNDSLEVTHGMWNFFDEYMRDNERAAARAQKNGWRIPITEDRESTNMMVYYNNFEVRLACCHCATGPQVYNYLDSFRLSM